MSSTAINLDDVRGDIAGAASRNERRNRPTHLVVIAIALAAISLVALLFMLRSRTSAQALLVKETKIGENAVELAQQLKEIRIAEESTTIRYGAAESDLPPSKFINAGAAAGLKNPIQLPTRNKPVADKDINGVHRIKVAYEAKDESMPNLMKWVQNVVRDIPGLEVYSISLKPEATQWVLKVTFSRWERTEPKK